MKSFDARLAMLCLGAAVLTQSRVTSVAGLDRDTGEPHEFHVSTSGNDANPGTKEKPFATILRARDMVRDWNRTNRLANITVWLSGGDYELAETFVLGREDGAKPSQSIAYAAMPGEKPVLSAGRRITGWKSAGGRWTVTLPEVAKGEWNFAQLFVNGERRFRPRLPREGYFYTAGPAPSSQQCQPGLRDRFRFSAGELKPAWTNLQDVEVLSLHEWQTSRLRISDVNEAEGVVTVSGGTHRDFNRGTRFLVENVREALAPGEWYLDRKSGELTYIPLPGEEPGRTAVVAPRLDRILDIKGDVAGRRWIENLSFRGITFAHCNWTTPPAGHCDPQAEATLGAAVHVEGARSCIFKQCVFARMGGYGLEFGDGCQRDVVRSCEFSDLGGGGIKIGRTRSDDENVLASFITVRDCLIAHLGRIHPSAVGVWVGHGHHITVDHNDIYDLYYSGISVGWSWGYGATPNHDNAVTYNRIHDAMQMVLTDGAAIYTLGLQPGSVMRGNVVYNVEGLPWAVGIYLDEGSSGWTCEDNLVYNVTTHDFNVNYGRDNVARNNIFGPILDPGAPLLRCGRIEDHRSMTVENNLIYFTVGDLVDEVWPEWPVSSCLVRSNLYWNAAGLPVRFRDKTWEQWRSGGQDAGSIIADPMFVDPAKGDFRLKPDSPASLIGFKPFDFSKAGCQVAASDPDARFPRVYPKNVWNPPYTLARPDVCRR